METVPEELEEEAKEEPEELEEEKEHNEMIASCVAMENYQEAAALKKTWADMKQQDAEDKAMIAEFWNNFENLWSIVGAFVGYF